MRPISTFVHLYQHKYQYEHVLPTNVELIFKQRNWIHRNGRINATLPNGPYLALTVSPYVDDFEYQIEEGVKPLVMALRARGYLTTSSCEGHGWRDPIKVMLAFGSEASCQDFVVWFNQQAYPYTTCEIQTDVANIESQQVGHSLKHTRTDEVDQRRVAHWFNVFFHRNYDHYRFCEIKFGECPEGLAPWELWLAYKVYKYRELNKNEVINQIANDLVYCPDYLL